LIAEAAKVAALALVVFGAGVVVFVVGCALFLPPAR
jgi:hypothetical protein